jgi:hypothetical protein
MPPAAARDQQAPPLVVDFIAKIEFVLAKMEVL